MKLGIDKTLVALAALAYAPLAALAAAQAGPPTQIATTLTSISTWLTSVGIVIITIAVMWAGYKMAFAGARFADISNIFVGAAISGAAGVIAGWFFG
jgi:type IV secretion system protein VirB2